MNQNDINALEASGLKPIVIDENFDFNQLSGLFHPVPTLNWALLRQQKTWLSGFYNGKDSEYAEGLISLLDYLQDDAVDTGRATELEVFGTEENPERNE